jgi:hypothetical protein
VGRGLVGHDSEVAVLGLRSHHRGARGHERKEVHRTLLDSLERGNGKYVINMLKADKYDAGATIKELNQNGVIAAVSDPESLAEIVGVLYQIRCNVFHGEKAPGNVNDDCFVKLLVHFWLLF